MSKNQVEDAVLEALEKFGLAGKILCSKAPKVYGDVWARFIGSCNPVLGFGLSPLPAS